MEQKDYVGTKPKDVGKFVSEFYSICPRCGSRSKVTKTTKYFINTCDSCGFDMGVVRCPE